jgi:hydroxypyruvate reductase
MHHLLESSFLHALKSTSPKRLVQKHLPKEKPSLILAVGKAALPMLEGALEVFPDVPCLLTSPLEADKEMRRRGDKGTPLLLPGTHPIPSQHSVTAAEKALELASQLSEKDLLLVLVSGGGSSLWCAPWGITLQEKQGLTQALLRAGADIQELNTVRKHLSTIKGGRLAKATRARVSGLLLSDVVGDDMTAIASGPTVADPSTFADATEVLDKYKLDFPEVRKHFQRGMSGEIPESPKPDDAVFAKVENKIIGSNYILLKAAQEYLIDQGYEVRILSDRFTGDTRELARFHASLVQSIGHKTSSLTSPIILLSGGETTVQVKGEGKGGRNQEFMLWLLHFLQEQGVWALSCGSDGIDGNSSAAGAFLRPDSFERAKAQGLGIEGFLNNSDSNVFFQALGDALEIGPTQHNLNDFRAILIQ